MRYLLLALCLLFTSQVYGQKKGKRKRKVKSTYFLNVQGGLLVDKPFDLTYTGFNLVNLGYSKIKNNTQRSLQLELLGYNISQLTTRIDTFMNVVIEEPISGSGTKRRSIELLYNYSFGLTDIMNGFFIGPSGSLVYNYIEKIPVTTAQFPVSQPCLCLGMGMNIGYNASINKNLMLSISSRFTLLDIGWEWKRVRNPSITVQDQRISKFQADLIRNQFQLNIGLNFKI